MDDQNRQQTSIISVKRICCKTNYRATDSTCRRDCYGCIMCLSMKGDIHERASWMRPTCSNCNPREDCKFENDSSNNVSMTKIAIKLRPATLYVMSSPGQKLDLGESRVERPQCHEISSDLITARLDFAIEMQNCASGHRWPRRLKDEHVRWHH